MCYHAALQWVRIVSQKFSRTVVKLDLSATLQIWRQVIIAELLNLLEKRRYDACN